jgi:ubiquinone/menaquinone biosynthesis C-methylase UbiE
VSNEYDWGASFAAASSDDLSFYDEIMVPRLFEPWAHVLLDRVKPFSGQDVLDVACGPGSLTRHVARRVGPTGAVTGCDLSLAMLDIARSKVAFDESAPITFVECPADSLDLPDRVFDLVTCQQGLQFFPERSKALAEMRRVVRPDARLGIAVWCEIEASPPFAALATAIGRVLGRDYEAAYRDGPWGLTDRKSLVELVEESGFTQVEVDRVGLPVAFEGVQASCC